MIVKSKYKIAKRLGAEVFEKTQSQKFALSEARRKNARTGRRPRALSDFGRQLLEKQKVRYTYGISEKQLTRYVTEALKTRGTDPLTTLYRKLEMRLDSVVYRLGLAPTRRMARQLVSHGHICVNGRKVTIPSYSTRTGETITVRSGSAQKTVFAGLHERLADYSAPSWVSFDAKKLTGSVKELPQYSAPDTHFDLTQVLEYYSR
ncbi:30S ribosomal protein S4 [Candidatus Kaiserbacteria bacterium CG10_big_fil_rev_8_21_14_0_10_49_17]|uniref:Small ribosomal subunit protein uS4 n=1 Tax=Candidatus Kaiserbacteria bacterium CG10_big_fil_rev_8_21_14_0_10_49_17 TaxID=1974609 RepID=A0A2M6WF35_9BACT|nr:MAG: 30S ribosomal protein S4 [Candidatus Kaiserbacteria bacterium CG10_big_fil_rev_8_21_14_0_10_49_17]